MPKDTPKLRLLRYGEDKYCELCKRTIRIGDPVGWWTVPRSGGGTRLTAYCPDCHHANVRHGRALLPKGSR